MCLKVNGPGKCSLSLSVLLLVNLFENVPGCVQSKFIGFGVVIIIKLTKSSFPPVPFQRS
uniref:Uncharacterized protein n=1 Tax=Rhizophora mucronata TaxID=61149 RepID=A0A2P2LCS4_RHIMU